MVRNKGLFTEYNSPLKADLLRILYRQGSEMKETKKLRENVYLILHVCIGQYHTRRVNIQKKE